MSAGIPETPTGESLGTLSTLQRPIPRARPRKTPPGGPTDPSTIERAATPTEHFESRVLLGPPDADG